MMGISAEPSLSGRLSGRVTLSAPPLAVRCRLAVALSVGGLPVTPSVLTSAGVSAVPDARGCNSIFACASAVADERVRTGRLPLARPSAVASVAGDELVPGPGRTECESSPANDERVLPARRMEPLSAISLSAWLMIVVVMS